MLLAALLVAMPIVAEETSATPFKVLDGGGIVYGKELGVVVSAPKGWIFDAESGVNQGLHAVMYPDGSTWANAAAVMYVKIGGMKTGEALTDFIAGDIASFKEKSSQCAVQTADPIDLAGGGKAEMRFYSGDVSGNYEAVAYAAKGNSVAIYVLSCRTAEAFHKSVPDFRHMVASSVFVGMVFKK